MDISLIYGVLTAATAISSGFAGAYAARLSKKTSESGVASHDIAVMPRSAEINRMQQGVADAISERYAGAQNASAWLATSTALFGVASTRPIRDVIGAGFLLIGASLVAVAVQAILKATEATALPTARSCFEGWYLPWIRARRLEGSIPTDEEVAFAFAAEHTTSAATLQRFQVWPFHFAYLSEAIHLSRQEHIRGR